VRHGKDPNIGTLQGALSRRIREKERLANRKLSIHKSGPFPSSKAEKTAQPTELPDRRRRSPKERDLTYVAIKNLRDKPVGPALS